MFGMILVAELLLPRRSVRELKTPAVLRKLFTLKICKNLLKFVSLGLSYLVLSTFHQFIGIILKTLYSPAVVLTREFFFFFLKGWLDACMHAQRQKKDCCLRLPSPHQSQEFCDAGSVLANPADEVHDQLGHRTGIHHGERTVLLFDGGGGRVCVRKKLAARAKNWSGRIADYLLLGARTTTAVRTYEVIRWNICRPIQSTSSVEPTQLSSEGTPIRQRWRAVGWHGKTPSEGVPLDEMFVRSSTTPSFPVHPFKHVRSGKSLFLVPVLQQWSCGTVFFFF